MSARTNGTSSLPEFVPVVIIGAGRAGIAAATLLGQYGVETLVLERHETVYPLPRAVEADDEGDSILGARPTWWTASWPGWASPPSPPPTLGLDTVFG